MVVPHRCIALFWCACIVDHGKAETNGLSRALSVAVGTVPPLSDLLAPTTPSPTPPLTVATTLPPVVQTSVAPELIFATAAPSTGSAGFPWFYVLMFIVAGLVCCGASYFVVSKMNGKGSEAAKKTKKGSKRGAPTSPGSPDSPGSFVAQDANVYAPLPTSAMITPTYQNLSQSGAMPATNVSLAQHGMSAGSAPPTNFNLAQGASLDRAAALETPTYRNLPQSSANAQGAMPPTSPWLQGGPQYPGLPATGTGSLPQTSGVPPPTSAWLPGAGGAPGGAMGMPTTQWLPGTAPPTSSWVPNQMPYR